MTCRLDANPWQAGELPSLLPSTGGPMVLQSNLKTAAEEATKQYLGCERRTRLVN
jgi:hypothetical protein